MSCWDTSALLKLYLTEADSPQYLARASSASAIITAFIGKHEARAAFRRRESEGVLSAGGADLCFQRLLRDVQTGRVCIIPESPELDREFGGILDQCLSQVPPVFVRTNDALHLAAAKVAGETEFLTADARQAAAATLIGLTVKP